MRLVRTYLKAKASFNLSKLRKLSCNNNISNLCRTSCHKEASPQLTNKNLQLCQMMIIISFISKCQAFRLMDQISLHHLVMESFHLKFNHIKQVTLTRDKTWTMRSKDFKRWFKTDRVKLTASSKKSSTKVGSNNII